jgi:transposase
MIAVGVDTHKQRHHAVALDLLGQLLGELSFAANAAGYAELQRWAEGLRQEQPLVFGIEGAGSWGAGLCEHLQGAGHSVVEVERPRRRERRAGKSDRIDALAAAKCALSDENTSTPRGRRSLAALRALLVARRSAVAEHMRVLNQLQALNATAPVALRERVGDGSGKQLERRVTSMRARASADIEERAVFAVMRDLAARSRALAADARRYEQQLADLVRSLDHTLLDEPGPDRSRPPSCSRATRLASSTKRLRPLQRNRAPASLIRQDRPPPTQPRRRPPGQQRDRHHGRHPRQAPTRNARLPRPPHQRGKDQARSHAPTQTPHLPRPLQTPRRRPLDFIEASLTVPAQGDRRNSSAARLFVDPGPWHAKETSHLIGRRRAPGTASTCWQPRSLRDVANPRLGCCDGMSGVLSSAADSTCPALTASRTQNYAPSSSSGGNWIDDNEEVKATTTNKLTPWAPSGHANDRINGT